MHKYCLIHIVWLGLVFGLLWYGLGTEPAAVPLVTLRFDDDNGGLGCPSGCLSHILESRFRVSADGRGYVITRKMGGVRDGHLQMLVLAPNGRVIRTAPLRRNDGQPLTMGCNTFLVSPGGTRWWIIRYAAEDNGTPMLLSVHGPDGRALQEWRLGMVEFHAEYLWCYAIGEDQVCLMYADNDPMIYTRGQAKPQSLPVPPDAAHPLAIAIMPDGRVVFHDYAYTGSGRHTFTVYMQSISRLSGGASAIWTSLSIPTIMGDLFYPPSETGLYAVCELRSPPHPSARNWYESRVLRLPRQGGLESAYDLTVLLKGRKWDRRPVYVNRHGDVWVVTTTQGEKGRSGRSTLWKLTHRPRWQNWLQALSNLLVPR
jgi:hypothetical protein